MRGFVWLLKIEFCCIAGRSVESVHGAARNLLDVCIQRSKGNK